MKRQRSSEEESALELAGDALFLLRRMPAAAWLGHLAGAVPFLAAGLLFWSDMCHGVDAADRVSTWALLLVPLFVWHKFWQADFCRHLRAELAGLQPEPWTAMTIRRALVIQAALQPWGLLLIPLAALLMAPFPWVLGFFQGVTVLAGSPPGTPAGGRVVSRSWRQTARGPAAHFVLLLLLKLAALLLVINLALGGALVVFLGKKLLDIDSAFTMGVAAFFNTTFLAVVLAVATLLFDPLLKAVYTLRTFREEAAGSGEDLRGGLRYLRRVTRPALVILAVAFCLAGNVRSVGAAPAGSESSGPVRVAEVPARDLDRAIDRTLNGRDYRWRLPRDAARERSETDDEAVGWPEEFRRWMGRKLETLGSALGRQLQRIFGGLRGFDPNGRAVSWSLFSVDSLLLALICVAVGALVWVLVRWWIRRQRTVSPVVVAEPVIAVPDLARDDVRPDALPVDEWLRLAAELRARGEFRLAMRAFFLSALAHLGERGLVQPARFKSNRDYARELQRRAHALPEVPGMFAGLVAALERTWYGYHDVDAAGLDTFAVEVERLKSC